MGLDGVGFVDNKGESREDGEHVPGYVWHRHMVILFRHIALVSVLELVVKEFLRPCFRVWGCWNTF